MRHWTIIANGPVDDCSDYEPYTAGLEVKRHLEKYPDAAEADIERIAAQYKCRVRWEGQGCPVRAAATDRVLDGTKGVREKMRHWQIIEEEAGSAGPRADRDRAVSEAVFYCMMHSDAAEADIEHIAARYGCHVRWFENLK